MNIIIPITLIPLFLSGINLPYFIPQINRENITQTELAQTNPDALEVALSETVLVYPKAGGSLSGTLTNFNDQSLTISARGNSRSFPTIQIKQVKFQGQVWNPVDNPRNPRISRGTINQNKSNEKVWSNIPVSAFILHQNSRKASLKLGTVLTSENWQDLLDISKESIYIIDEISFDNSGKTMTIKALIVDRKKL